jgi:hypothetical protein
MKILHSQGVVEEEAPLIREEEVEVEGLTEALSEAEASVMIEVAEVSVVIGEEELPEVEAVSNQEVEVDLNQEEEVVLSQEEEVILVTAEVVS